MYFEMEMEALRVKPLWDKFDSTMRSALIYQARKRAEKKAREDRRWIKTG